MISIGDYVTFATEQHSYLRGIIVAGPRLDKGPTYAGRGDSYYCVMWDDATRPPEWEPRPNGAWEAGSNLKVLSSLKTRWV